MSLYGYVKKNKPALWTKIYPQQHSALHPPCPPKKKANLSSKKFSQRSNSIQSRKPLKRIASATPQMAARRRRYNLRVKDWLQQIENKWCKAWEAFGESKLATQCHHKNGRKMTREGDLLLAEQFWIPVSASGHDWIHKNIEQARKLGLICEAGRYNSWPKDLK
jgi:hypothetical protein